jgi:hypothetical protein
MKSEQAIQSARDVIRAKVIDPNLSIDQKILLSGMLNALVWVMDGADCRTMDDILVGRPFDKGKSRADLSARAKRFLRGE